MSKAHPGFKAVQAKIQREGYSKRAAGAILANASRHASASAKRKNPRLKRVGDTDYQGGMVHVTRAMAKKAPKIRG
jgi:hypothetical protein